MERVMFTLSNELLQEVDEEARQCGRKRSQVVRLALEEWLRAQKRERFEALLAEGYTHMAKQADEWVADSLLAQSTAAQGTWEWDE